MAATGRRNSKEEFARRGDAIYENDVAPQLKTGDEGKFAAIDIESGTYEIDLDELAACDKLSARIPAAQIWLVRVGSRFLHRFGRREKRGMPFGSRIKDVLATSVRTLRKHSPYQWLCSTRVGAIPIL
jgi:hypothetical protein